MAHGYPEALFALAYMNQEGLGVPQDLDLAERLYSSIVESAEMNDVSSKYPAQIALYGLKMKRYAGSIGIIDRFIDFVSRMMSYLI